MEKIKHGVRQTRGTFKLVGKVFGTKSDRFFKTTTFDTGTTKNAINFGVKTSKNNETYVTLEGYDSKTIKFQKYDFWF